jgi:hypothetical protein
MSTQYCGCDPTHAGGPHYCERHKPAEDDPKNVVMWGLSDALTLVREIQPQMHALGYHVCLAGGVLNKGYSIKDLDLVFVPMTNEDRPPVAGLCTWFNDQWGLAKENVTDPEPCVSLRYQASYLHFGRRIDVFVV